MQRYLIPGAEPETVTVGDAFRDAEGTAYPSNWLLLATADDLERIGAELLPPEPPPAPSLAEYQAAIEAHVEATAQARSYSSAVSCASYLNSTVPAWAAEAAAFVTWRDQVWLEVYETLAAVQGGAPAPTIAELVAGLPVIGWPA